MKMLIAAFALIAACSASAYADDCKSITDAQARLACFDRTTKPTPKAKTTKKRAAPVDEFAVAKSMLQRKMIDPESARFTDMFKVQTEKEGAILCGLVNSKNRMGGYVGNKGFVFEPTMKRATIMATGDSDPDYSMQAAAAYCIHCAQDPRSDRTFTPYCPSMFKFRRPGT